MAGSFTLSIPSLSAMLIGPSLRAEACEINAAVEKSLRTLVATQSTSFNILDRSGANIGTVSWVPVNTA
jgi:hypothetical protein